MTATPDLSGPLVHAQRAAVAERSVTTLFGRRMGGLPFTHLARVAHPASRRPTGPWHYWWQAHYLDAVVDAGLRALRSGDVEGARRRAARGDRLLATVRLRNLGRITNQYYDDMAWLALAVGRLTLLHEALGRATPRRRLRVAEVALTRQLRSAVTPELGGGAYWNTTRDFKNVPATAPVALHLARLGQTQEAHRLVDWLYERLVGETGLFLDGIRVAGGVERVVPDVWSYNQGTVLGALVTMGDAGSLCRSADLVHAVAEGLSSEGVLRTHGDGDGGLFTGILVRYLALAAGEPRLAEETKQLAESMVTRTAEAFWAGRAGRVVRRADDVVVFSPDPLRPASTDPSVTVELSTQLQAWMTLEAAAVVAVDG
ncbi:MAG: glycoside hydrolase family 76 protein [Lapillicoccus sp.]